MLVDFESLKKHYEGDIEIIAQLVEIFEESYIVSLDQLKIAIAEKDFPSIQLHAHTLKGMIGNFFAEDLKNAAYALEKDGRAQNLSEGYEKYLNQLETNIPSVIEELRKM